MHCFRNKYRARYIQRAVGSVDESILIRVHRYTNSTTVTWGVFSECSRSAIDVTYKRPHEPAIGVVHIIEIRLDERRSKEAIFTLVRDKMMISRLPYNIEMRRPEREPPGIVYSVGVTESGTYQLTPKLDPKCRAQVDLNGRTVGHTGRMIGRVAVLVRARGEEKSGRDQC